MQVGSATQALPCFENPGLQSKPQAPWTQARNPPAGAAGQAVQEFAQPFSGDGIRQLVPHAFDAGGAQVIVLPPVPDPPEALVPPDALVPPEAFVPPDALVPPVDEVPPDALVPP
ncbi:MAG: hypothetical protein FJ104_12630, partial [Deltaproteobacteria bacterium]|nr:hypothetical protein [Deltaproteobacteria bacterium]